MPWVIKDGIKIADTSIKIKPVNNSSYKVKTYFDGCYSDYSSSYYFIITDIINFENEKYIKVSPNPFSHSLNLNFELEKYKKLNIRFYQMDYGNLVLYKENVISNSYINTGHLSNGIYIIKVSSDDNKLIKTFKLLKF